MATVSHPGEPTSAQREETARLNDLLRNGYCFNGRHSIATNILEWLASEHTDPGHRWQAQLDGQRSILRKIAQCQPSAGDNPWGERDFGSIEHKGEKIFWKIDYYAPGKELLHASEEPWNDAKTYRILTIYFARDH